MFATYEKSTSILLEHMRDAPTAHLKKGFPAPPTSSSGGQYTSCHGHFSWQPSHADWRLSISQSWTQRDDVKHRLTHVITTFTSYGEKLSPEPTPRGDLH